MHHPSPYTLLREANGVHTFTSAQADLPEPPWTDFHTLAARWQDLLQPQPQPQARAATPAPAQTPAPTDGPAMRTPPPMHPPIVYPNATQVYDASAAASRPRHTNYDNIIEQHKNAAEKVVYVPAALE